MIYVRVRDAFSFLWIRVTLFVRRYFESDEHGIVVRAGNIGRSAPVRPYVSAIENVVNAEIETVVVKRDAGAE